MRDRARPCEHNQQPVSICSDTRTFVHVSEPAAQKRLCWRTYLMKGTLYFAECGRIQALGPVHRSQCISYTEIDAKFLAKPSSNVPLTVSLSATTSNRSCCTLFENHRKLSCFYHGALPYLLETIRLVLGTEPATRGIVAAILI